MLYIADITGLPAILAILLLLYIFIYIPLKLITKIIAHGSQKAEHVRKLQEQVVIAEYNPPEKFSPAEIGYLFDSKISSNEIIATISYLEQLGLIELDNENGIVIIKNVKSPESDINEFDQYILNQLKQNEGKQLIDKQIKKMLFTAEQVIVNDLQNKGFLIPTKEMIKGLVGRIVFIMATLIALLIALDSPYSLSKAIAWMGMSLIFSPVLFFISLFLYIRYTEIAGAPWTSTEKLKKLWPDIEGFRQYIKMVEEDRLKFESDSTKGLIKSKVLPYAIALGFDTGWQKKMSLSKNIKSRHIGFEVDK